MRKFRRGGANRDQQKAGEIAIEQTLHRHEVFMTRNSAEYQLSDQILEDHWFARCNDGDEESHDRLLYRKEETRML